MQRKQFHGKFLSTLLVAVLLLTLFPAAPITAYAAATETAGDADELRTAITNVDTDGTITLTNDFIIASAILINNKSFTLDLAEHTLTITNTGGYGISITGNYTLTIQGYGTLNVTGTTRGISAVDSGKFVVSGGAIVNATASAADGFGACADTGGTVNVTGDANAFGLRGRGAFATGSGSEVFVMGKAMAYTGSSYGALADNGGRVAVSGDATATSPSSYGAYADTGGTVDVTGDAKGSRGAYAVGSGTVNVTGDVTGEIYGAYASGVNSTVNVTGDVTATGATGIGAYADNSGNITIDGSITAPIYIKVGYTEKAPSQYTTQTTKADYLTYTDETNTVWVKEVIGGAFFPVTNITNVPTTATAGTPLALTGTVMPIYATNKTIVWTVQNAGTTGANITGGNQLNTTAEGTATVTATITNGLTDSSNYTKDFSITVSPVTTAVAWSDITANGTANITDTTELTLTFSTDPTTLTDANISVSDATKGVLSGTGTTRTLAISAISVAEGENILVGIGNPAGFAITPGLKNVSIHKDTRTPITFSDLTANGAANITDTTELTLTFDVDPTTLTADNITVTGATKGTLSGTGTTRTLAISNITVAEGQNVTVAIADPTGFAITPTPKTVVVHKEAYIPVTGITGVPTAATVGTPVMLSGTALPSNATNKTIIWSGTGVSGNQFTPTSVGTATITATITNGLTTTSNYTQNFNITVSAAGSGGGGGGGGTPPPTPYTVTFDANGGSVSPASAQTDADGKVTTLPTLTRTGYRFDGWFTDATGGTQITTATVFSAASTIYAHWTKESVLTETPQPGQSVNVTAVRTPLKTLYLVKGKTLAPPVAFDGKDANGKAWGYGQTAKLTWKSSNTSIATVNASGKITAKKAGTAKITATALNGKAKVTFTVKVVAKALKLKKVALTKPPKSMKVGKTAVLKVKLTSAKATGIIVTFKSSKPSVIQVDKSGKLYALKKCTANITVKAGGKTKVITVKVK